MPERDLLSLWMGPPCKEDETWQVASDLAALTRASMNIEISDPPTAKDAMDIGLSLVTDTERATLDLGRTWLWLAASMRHTNAPLALAQEIVAEIQASNSRMGLKDLGKVAEWLRRARIRRSRVTPLHPASDGDDMDRVFGATPTSVILASIGHTSTKSGQDIFQAWGHYINHPFPVLGQDVDPAEVADEMLTIFPWAGKLAGDIERYLTLLRRAGSGNTSLPPMLLHGPAGCGKTTIAGWLAERCGLKSKLIPLGGTSDSGGIGAVGRGWNTAQPCGPFLAMVELNTANPAIILDEVDKGVVQASAQNGSPIGAVISMLQGADRKFGYRDNCLLSDVDLSMISWIATANRVDLLPAAFMDRFSRFSIPAPSPEHFDAILPGVIRNQARILRVDEEMMPLISPSDRQFLKSAFAQSRGSIRTLERAYLLVCGQTAVEEQHFTRH